MSRIFDELKKFRGKKSEPTPPPAKGAFPFPTESLKAQFTSKPEKPRKINLRILLLLGVGIIFSLVAILLLPRLLFKSEPPKKETPQPMVMPKRAPKPRPALEKEGKAPEKEAKVAKVPEKEAKAPEKIAKIPEKPAKKLPSEVLIEEIIISEPSIQEIVEIAPEPVKEAPKVVIREATPAIPEAVKPEKPFIEVIELLPATPPAPEVAATKRLEEERPKIEIKAAPPIPRPEAPPIEKVPAVVRPEISPERPEERRIEAGKPLAPPPPKEVVVAPAVPKVPEVARERVAPPVTGPAEGPAPVAPPEEEVTAGLRKIQRAEKFKLALFYQKSGETKKAEAQYQELLKENPMDAEAHNNLGSIYQELGYYEKAETEFRKAVLLRPDYLGAHNNLGVALYKKGNLDGALREFQALLEANPRDVQSLTNLGVVLKKQGDLLRANSAFQKVLQIDPTHAEAHYNLAIILEEEGEVAKAVYHYQKFLESSRGKYASLAEEVSHHLVDISQRGWR
ncbi:MAG TPA: tetratricopeptide repeat protein [Candidatus Tripitaka californicus]|uniref:tetratricopeptide repeat protein n=1 Tax=Candidatus Tripitaka californicus TaxID=3367616 RepID=UPI00402866E5